MAQDRSETHLRPIKGHDRSKNLKKKMHNLKEFVETSVILTPGALLVGCEPQFVLHFVGIRWIRGIRGDAPKLIFEQ